MVSFCFMNKGENDANTFVPRNPRHSYFCNISADGNIVIRMIYPERKHRGG